MPKLDANLRFNSESIEDKFHFILQCVAYNDLKENCLSKQKLPEHFPEMEALTAQFILVAYNYRSKRVKKTNYIVY